MTTSLSDGALLLSESVRSSVGEAYRPDIDGLRAIAALVVVAAHAGVLRGGSAGVDIFFVISGYLISGLILRALARGSFSSFEFYARRVKRIFPSLITLLIAAAGLGWLTLLGAEHRRLGKEIMGAAGFIYNLSMHAPDFHSPLPRIDLGHLWSLGVEEQFYLLWPLILIMIWKMKSRQLALIAALTTMSFAICVMEGLLGKDNYSLPWSRMWQLSLGGAFAYMQSCRAADLERLRYACSKRPISWLGLHNNHARGLIGAALLVVSCVSAFYGWRTLVPTLGSLLIITADMKGWFNRYILGSPPLVAIGLISYPLYLWHYILLQIPHLIFPQVTPIMTVSAVIGTFLFSFVTYKYIELPLRYSQKTTVVASALCVAMLACGILGYAMFLERIPERSAPPEARNFSRASMEDWLPGTRGISWTRGSDKFITLGIGSQKVLYIGDSNMQQFYPRVEKLLVDHPLNSHGAVFATRDWCAPVETYIPGSLGATDAACRAFVHDAFDYAKGPTVDTVVISACWRCYFLSFDDELGRSGKLNAGVEQALGRLQQRIESLMLAGKRVYVVLGIPVGLDLDPRLMIYRIVLPPGFRLIISSPKRSELITPVEPVRSRLAKIARTAGATVIDPIQSLCDETICSPVTPTGDPVYHDWFNLSPSYVRKNVRFLDETVLDPGLDGAAQTVGPPRQ